MGKLNFLPAAAALFVCACSAGTRHAAQPAPPADPLEAVVSAILDKTAHIPDRTLAVYDITGVSGEATAEGRLVAERLTSRLAASGKVRVIERRRLEAALKELSLSASGAVDEAGLARAGFMSGAGAVVTGTLARLDSGYELNARAVNVVTGDVIAAASALLRINLAEGGASIRSLPSPRTSPAGADAAAGPPPPGWKLWPGRGKASFRDGAIVYCIESRQMDYGDAPRSGYYPGLLLEKELAGKKWELEIRADYDAKGFGGQWLSAFVWLGEKDAHPHRSSPRSALSLTASRQKDTGYDIDDFGFAYEPGGELVRFGREIDSVRFERDGDRFTVYGGVGGKDFRKAFSVYSPRAGAAPSQRIVLGGQAFGDPGSCATYRSIKLNGKPLF